MDSVKKTYTVFPDSVSAELLDECILDSLSISHVVNKILSEFSFDAVNSDTLYVNLDFCEFNSFLYNLYDSLSHFLIISFGGFYQLILDTVQVSDVKEGD